MSDELQFLSKMENLLGLTVEITMNNNTKIIGNIFTYNSQAKIIILVNKQKENDNTNVSIINMLEIKKIELSKKQIDINVDELCNNDLNYIKDKEKRNLEKDILIKRAETEPNFKRGLDVYEALSKFYKCSYDGKRIVLDEIGCYIEEPFRLKHLYCEDENNRERLEKIISSAIKKKNKKI